MLLPISYSIGQAIYPLFWYPWPTLYLTDSASSEIGLIFHRKVWLFSDSFLHLFTASAGGVCWVVSRWWCCPELQSELCRLRERASQHWQAEQSYKRWFWKYLKLISSHALKESQGIASKPLNWIPQCVLWDEKYWYCGNVICDCNWLHWYGSVPQGEACFRMTMQRALFA